MATAPARVVLNAPDSRLLEALPLLLVRAGEVRRHAACAAAGPAPQASSTSTHKWRARQAVLASAGCQAVLAIPCPVWALPLSA